MSAIGAPNGHQKRVDRCLVLGEERTSFECKRMSPSHSFRTVKSVRCSRLHFYEGEHCVKRDSRFRASNSWDVSASLYTKTTVSITTGDHGPSAVIGLQQMFGSKRRTAVNQRAKLMGRMVILLTDGLYTKSYDQFVERYSNPGDEPDETARNARISRFEMRFSPTCWYEATASLPEKAQRWISIEGGGDDCGVFIKVRVPADANAPSCPVVDLHVPRGAKRGTDASAMVRALQDTPGWRRVAAI
jgi:hypothetical protein